MSCFAAEHHIPPPFPNPPSSHNPALAPVSSFSSGYFGEHIAEANNTARVTE
jgi:hypothetical protein